MTTTESDQTHPGLTIAVYRVDPTTMERTLVRSAVLPPSEEPLLSLAYPPCRCPRCSGRVTR